MNEASTEMEVRGWEKETLPLPFIVLYSQAVTFTMGQHCGILGPSCNGIKRFALYLKPLKCGRTQAMPKLKRR